MNSAMLLRAVELVLYKRVAEAPQCWSRSSEWMRCSRRGRVAMGKIGMVKAEYLPGNESTAVGE